MYAYQINYLNYIYNAPAYVYLFSKLSWAFPLKRHGIKLSLIGIYYYIHLKYIICFYLNSDVDSALKKSYEKMVPIIIVNIMV